MEFGEARHLHDLRDMNKCIDLFGSHDPFDGNVPQIRSLSIGFASSEGRVMASSVMKRRKFSVRYREVLRVFLSEMQPLKRRRIVHTLSESKPGSRWIR